MMQSRLMVLSFLLFCSNIYSQDVEISLTKIEKDTTIQNIGIYFKEKYVFPDKGEDLQRSMNLLNSQGVFDTIRNPMVFRRTVQNAIRNIIDDKHIIFIYRDPKDHQPFEPDAISDISDLKSEYEYRKDVNFGIPELKVLEKNT